ncbi:MAG: hypothetical protein WCY53_07920 [Sphaerochaetaceae bacterium]
MKKIALLVLSVSIILSLTGCFSFASLWPFVEAPDSPNDSMIVLEAGQIEDGRSTNLNNLNYSGWAPWVVDSNGNTVAFKNFDTESRLDSLYYAENLSAGTYTLKGFLHLYIDYSKLSEKEFASYGPFNNYHYHVTQKFELDKPVTLNLRAAEMATFGRYYISFEYTEGMWGTGDHRYRIKENSVSIKSDSSDKKALRVIKNWHTPGWKLWNPLNNEVASDN